MNEVKVRRQSMLRYIHMAKRVGTIITPPGVLTNKHEKLTADFLAITLGFDITFLVPERRRGAKTPDIEMNGLLWETKSPQGKSSRTIENNLRAALRQSPYIVLDLRHMDGRIPSTKLLKETEKQFTLAKSVKSLIVIMREEKHIDFNRSSR